MHASALCFVPRFSPPPVATDTWVHFLFLTHSLAHMHALPIPCPFPSLPLHSPQMCTATIESLKKLMARTDRVVPVFGICLGHQLLSIAAGLTTYKVSVMCVPV